MKWIKHLFGFHDWQYTYLENRHCTICLKVQYSADFMDILGNQIIN